MKCVFCAEEIQDAAILCRFCGAVKDNGQWVAFQALASPAVATPRTKGSFTIKSSGVFFAISGLFSLASITSDVPLFGAMRGGTIAIGYNLFFAALFFGMAIGLIFATPWGFRFLLTGTILYSLDKVLFLLDEKARTAYLAGSDVMREAAAVFGSDFINQANQLLLATTVISMACWWGFVLYVYLRRGYFQQG